MSSRESVGGERSSSRRAGWIIGIAAGVGVCVGLVSLMRVRAVNGESPAAATTTPVHDYGQIGVMGDNTWYVDIGPSGGGQYVYGSSDFASFPDATFDYKALVSRLYAATEAREGTEAERDRKRKEGGWYSVAFSRPGVSLSEMRDTRNVAEIRAVFEKALAAAPPTPRMAKLLEERPPLPPAE